MIRFFVFFLIVIQSIGCKENNLTAQVDKSSSLGDPRWSATEYRNENWHPDRGQYFFSEMWTWSYQNDLREVDEGLPKGEMSFYIDPPTGTILLTREDTKYQGDMISWIIIHQDGRYLIGGSDENGKGVITSASINDLEDFEFRMENQKADFENQVKSLDQIKTFGANDYGWPTIEATEHEMSYIMMDDVTRFFLASVPFSMRYFYLVEDVVSDIKLPISQTYGYILPESALLVSESYQFGDDIMESHLVSMSPSEYFIDTASFVEGN